MEMVVLVTAIIVVGSTLETLGVTVAVLPPPQLTKPFVVVFLVRVQVAPILQIITVAILTLVKFSVTVPAHRFLIYLIHTTQMTNATYYI